MHARNVVISVLALSGLLCRLSAVPSPLEEQWPRLETALQTAVPALLEEQQRLLESAMDIATPTPGIAFQVQVDRVAVLSRTVTVTFTITAPAQQVVLFDTPILCPEQSLEGEPPTPDSLEQARFALVDLITRGQAQASLEFPCPGGEPPWRLVFNPLREPGNGVAPRVEVEIAPDR